MLGAEFAFQGFGESQPCISLREDACDRGFFVCDGFLRRHGVLAIHRQLVILLWDPWPPATIRTAGLCGLPGRRGKFSHAFYGLNQHLFANFSQGVGVELYRGIKVCIDIAVAGRDLVECRLEIIRVRMEEHLAHIDGHG